METATFDIHLRMDWGIVERLKREAAAQHRTPSKQVEFILAQRYGVAAKDGVEE